ncbi:MAG: hypothetical protein CMH81_06080 [Nitrospiraceae bacterium]|jgi:hypothetical protein|nr:hypothetical protein [Nitrospiraceae bacterium]
MANDAAPSSKHLPTFTGKTSGMTIDGVKMNGATYSDWRYKLQGKARSQGENIWLYMTSDPGAPENLSEEEKKKFDGFLTIITDSLSDGALQVVKLIREQNPQKVLAALDAAFFNQSVLSRVSAITDLINVKQKVGESVDAFVSAKKSICREQLGSKISIEELMMGAVIAGCLDDYADLVSTATASSDAVQVTEDDLDNLLDKLRTKENRLKDAPRKEVEIQNAKALTAEAIQTAMSAALKEHGVKKSNNKPKKTPKKNTPKKKGPRCYNCKEYGHMKANCPNKGNSGPKK